MALVRIFRRYFSHDPRWVLLTTRGRASGLPREVLLPCGRTADSILLISAYGRRSNWFQNLQRDPRVTVSAAGWVLEGRAEIVDDPQAKRAIVAAHPFIPSIPVIFVPFVLHPLLFPIARPLLFRFIERRPLVIVRLWSSAGSVIVCESGRGRHP
jgi:deazaflavin-dependent oxidoreductase (nitroreductase family)